MGGSLLQKFHRPVVKNFIMAVLIHGIMPAAFAIKKMILSLLPGRSELDDCNLSVTWADNNEEEEESDLYLTEEDSLLVGTEFDRQEEFLKQTAQLVCGDDDSADPEEPVLFLNWDTNVCGEAKRRYNVKDGVKLVPFQISHGVGIMHGGSAEQVRGLLERKQRFSFYDYNLDNPGKFDGIIAIYYPSRQLVRDWFLSRFILKYPRDKTVGDGVTVITVPCRPNQH